MDYRSPSAFRTTASNTQAKWLIRLALFATVLAFCVILKGAYTRLVDAGLGCPDWPGCYGFLSVPNETHEIALAESRFPGSTVEVHKGWPEMIHRYMASTLGLSIIGLAVLAWRSRQSLSMPRKHTLALVALVVLQGLFGMWTVTLKLWPQVVTAHLLGGMTTLALLALLVMRMKGHRVVISQGLLPEVNRRRNWAVAALVMLVIQIFLGGWVTSNYAALACPDFPTCQQQWLPEMDFKTGFNFFQEVGPNYLGGMMHNEARVAIHMAHRLGAFIASLLIIISIWQLWGIARILKIRHALILAGALLSVQVGLGLTNVLALLPLPVAVAHNGVAALLLLSLVWLNFRLFTLRGTPE